MEKEDLQQKINEKISIKEISEFFKIPISTIYYKMRKFGIKPNFIFNTPSKEELNFYYLTENLTHKQISKKLNISEKSVDIYLKKYLIPLKGSGRNQFPKITFEHVQKEFKKNGHLLISKEYENSNKKLDYICRCGIQSKMSYSVCKRGGGCKTCGIEKIRKYSLDFPKHIRDYKKYPEFRKKCAKIQRERFPEKYKARQIVKRALENRKLIKPEICSKCKIKKKRIEGHHEDYSKALEVIWLCVGCHKNLHLNKEVVK